MEKNDFIYWLRWFAILPGSLLAALVANILLHLVLYETLTSFINPYPESPERILYPAVTIASFVLATAYIAPKHKLKVAIIISIALLSMLAITIFIALNGLIIFGKQLFYIDGGTKSVMAVLGIFVGLFIVWRDKKLNG